MSDALNQTQFAQIVSAVLGALKASGQGAAPSGAAPQPKSTFGQFNPIQKDRGLIAGFKRKGIKESDIKLMDRNDPKAEFNVRPYGNAEKGSGWLGQGRVVRKGERGVRGLFHVSQTDPLVPAKPSPVKDKPSLKSVKPQLPLV
jgi:hypothetical protein